MYLNEVTVIGRMTRDVELRALPSGVYAGNFGVATNRTWKDKNTGEKKEEVEFHNVVSFGKSAETIAQYFHKGDEIFVRGRLKTSAWEKDGTKHYKTEIMLERFEFGQKRKDGASTASSSAVDDYRNDVVSQHVGAAEGDEINPDDIPF